MMMMMMMMIILTTNRRRKDSNDAAQQGRTEILQWRFWQPLYGPCVTLEHSSQPAAISCMSVFGEGGKLENPEKNP